MWLISLKTVEYLNESFFLNLYKFKYQKCLIGYNNVSGLW